MQSSGPTHSRGPQPATPTPTPKPIAHGHGLQARSRGRALAGPGYDVPVPLQEQALKDLKALRDEVEPRLRSGGSGGQYIHGTDVEREAFRARLGAAIERWTRPGSSYRQDLSRIESEKASTGWRALALFGVLKAVLADYEAGFMATVEELVHADLFADFLEMAGELLAKRYKDAAAVITGSVLEEHLRKLAALNGVSILAGAAHKKADTLNAELVKAGVYNKLEQKNVTAWLGLRNDAAHGNYANYDEAQVRNLLDNVRDFLVRHPA
jgi:hypothetical protein